MALVVKDRVLETSNTNGTGTFTLAGAVNGFQAFSVIGVGNTTYYAITEETNNQWEVGLGTVGSGTLTRDTVLSSSNNGNKVDFADGLKQVFCDYPASKSVNLDANGKVLFGGNTYEDFASISAPDYAEGRVWFDSGNHTLSQYNDVTNNIVHLGEEVQLKVINNTGSSIPNGSPVYITSTSSGQTYPNIALAKADTLATSNVIGLTNGAIANGQAGYVTTIGLLNPANTGTFAVGDVLYLSPYSAGQIMNTLPPTGYPIRLGIVAYSNNPNGAIYITKTNVYSLAANIVGTVAVANGGTGVTTSTGTGSVVLNTSPTLTTPAITGGTIDNTVIGGTTSAAGTFTTITGQTEVLKGTGSNLLQQSNTFSNAYWTNTAGTLTGSQSDPFGGSTAFLLVPTVTNTNHWLYSGTYGIAASPYTLSIYIKASGYSLVYLSDVGNGTYSCSYNLSAVTATPNTGCTGTITAVTGATGWYRITLTTTATISTNSRFTITGYPAGATLGVFGASFAGDGTSGIVIYGSQAEFGSTANTYIPTTTTAIYGTPTLSFSGVAGLGLQSDGSLYVSPAGTGALQAQATTSTTAGGNARGAKAVDWQTERATAAQVASGANSFVGGGYANYSNNYCGVTAGGYANGSTYLSSVGGGQGNFATAQWSAISGGNANTGSGYGAFIGGGSTNTAAGYFNVIGGGFTNAGTALAAVTTQSGTMNATTAVTLSGSNASIKVGQYITGTSIASDTYVAAISGTALTLSKVASGSSTSTLSFFTPHGVVVGGGNNQATGSYSFIGGGGDAGTAANRNVASGDWSVVGGGTRNVASAIGSFIGGGGTQTGFASANTASGEVSAIVGGLGNNASATGSSIIGGYQNLASGTLSAVLGGRRGTSRSIIGNTVISACNNPIADSAGVSQSAILVLGKETTNATATVITSDGGAASGTNQVILPNNSAYYFTGEVISGVTGGGNTKGWTISGVIKRGANAGATTLVGSTVTSLYADAGATTWTIGLTADTTNGGLAVTFTGQASTTIRTVCQIRTTEMTY